MKAGECGAAEPDGAQPDAANPDVMNPCAAEIFLANRRLSRNNPVQIALEWHYSESSGAFPSGILARWNQQAMRER